MKTGALPGLERLGSVIASKRVIRSMPKQMKPPPYRNIFTMDRLGKMPLVLRDGSSVEFPSNWTKEEAEAWRKAANLHDPKRD